jgi:ribose 1,5-bisphosphokinase PhnN
MTNFVWFYGPTAVGKDTLIHSMAINLEHNLITDLGLELPLVIHEEALRLRHEQRYDIADKLAQAARPRSTILIKAQGYDVARLIPLDLKTQFPNDRHLVVYLDADPSVIRERRIKRGQQPDTWDDVMDRKENLGHAYALEAAGMDFVWLDNNGTNPIITKRPEL